MLQMLISAQNSGSGKTTVTIALLAALKARGLNPCAFKPGPIILIPCFTAAYSALKVTILICFSQSCK